MKKIQPSPLKEQTLQDIVGRGRELQEHTEQTGCEREVLLEKTIERERGFVWKTLAPIFREEGTSTFVQENAIRCGRPNSIAMSSHICFLYISR